MAKKTNTLLEAMEIISSHLSSHPYNDTFLKQNSSPLQLLTSKLNITSQQAVLLSVFVAHSHDNNILVSEVAGDLSVNTIRMLMIQNDIDALVQRKFICRRIRDNAYSFLVPYCVLEALRDNKCYVPEIPKCSNLSRFFSCLKELFSNRENNLISELDMYKEIGSLLDNNKHLDFVSKVSAYKYFGPVMTLLLRFCHLFVANSDDQIREFDFHNLFDDDFVFTELCTDLECGNSELMRDKLVENAMNNGFKDNQVWKLTDRAKHDLLAELNINFAKTETPAPDVLLSKSITAKTLFYPAQVQSQVDELGQLLSPRNFRQIQRRMRAKGMRPGFACLFYGGPGTGKTETVLQLARQTGRDVMLVDIPKVRSCWVGESEKNVKEIFDRYRNLVKTSKRAPILLFNEADAIIGIRKEGANHSVDKMENTMQNIILQEMEAFDGILIATTNLSQNLDRAFERRFLYKIEFLKPDANVRGQIWHSMLPDVAPSDVTLLAQDFPFSGGQIENITRRYTIECILHGDPTDVLSSLRHYCETETIHQPSTPPRRIGFSA